MIVNEIVSTNTLNEGLADFIPLLRSATVGEPFTVNADEYKGFKFYRLKDGGLRIESPDGTMNKLSKSNVQNPSAVEDLLRSERQRLNIRVEPRLSSDSPYPNTKELDSGPSADKKPSTTDTKIDKDKVWSKLYTFVKTVVIKKANFLVGLLFSAEFLTDVAYDYVQDLSDPEVNGDLDHPKAVRAYNRARIQILKEITSNITSLFGSAAALLYIFTRVPNPGWLLTSLVGLGAGAATNYLGRKLAESKSFQQLIFNMVFPEVFTKENVNGWMYIYGKATQGARKTMGLESIQTESVTLKGDFPTVDMPNIDGKELVMSDPELQKGLKKAIDKNMKIPPAKQVAKQIAATSKAMED